MKKRVGAIEEFTFLPLTEGKQLHITIAITGWLASGKYREDQGRGGGHWLSWACFSGPDSTLGSCLCISLEDG